MLPVVTDVIDGIVMLLLYSNNGNRFGVFGVVNATVSASTVGGSTSRALTYTIVRRRGQVVGTDIIIRHSYNQVSVIRQVFSLRHAHSIRGNKFKFTHAYCRIWQ